MAGQAARAAAGKGAAVTKTARRLGQLALAVGISVATASAVGAVPPAARTPPSAKQQLLLEQMAASFPRRAVISARIAKAPPKERPSGYWLYFKSRASSSPQYVRGIWQSEIIAGLYLHEANAHGWVRPRWYDNTIVLPGGKERFDSGSRLSLTGPFSASGRIEAESKERLRELIGAGAARAGVRLVSVEFGRPLGQPAVQVTVVTDDPRGFVAEAGTKRGAIIGPINPDEGPALAEGALLEVSDRRGRWVFASGYSLRLGAGVGVVNPRFEK